MFQAPPPITQTLIAVNVIAFALEALLGGRWFNDMMLWPLGSEFAPEHLCILAHDACATRALAFGGATVPAESVQTAFLAALNGLFARVQTTAQVLEAL